MTEQTVREQLSKQLLEAATDCGNDGSWDGSGPCPKHPDDESSRFGFYNQHQVDITWHCWLCLVDEVERAKREPEGCPRCGQAGHTYGPCVDEEPAGARP